MVNEVSKFPCIVFSDTSKPMVGKTMHVSGFDEGPVVKFIIVCRNSMTKLNENLINFGAFFYHTKTINDRFCIWGVSDP